MIKVLGKRDSKQMRAYIIYKKYLIEPVQIKHISLNGQQD